DTYRIAAIEQIKTYAHILDVPIEVVYTIDDYGRAMNKFSAYDLILVDTAGRNFRDETYVKELHRSVNFDVKTYLVLSLTATPNGIRDIHAQVVSCQLKEVMFTKLDETLQFGSMINIGLNNKIKIAYITNGQDVPNDLIQPTPKSISNYIVGR